MSIGLPQNGMYECITMHWFAVFVTCTKIILLLFLISGKYFQEAICWCLEGEKRKGLFQKDWLFQKDFMETIS